MESEENDKDILMHKLESIIQISKELYLLENELALISDDFGGVQRNMPFLKRHADSKGISDEQVEDTYICGNVKYIRSPECLVGYGIFSGEIEENEAKACS